ncbi:MAG: hypothetical protein IIZ38_16125 [Sphingomonas sp.]|uniref:hypothetical protein n=1 Tax=Sphingomonas sp. TaxID=28214 RepID=UPI0025EFFEF8|nr:hypothetical protein [Sphingomonas sp.]MBQ1499837.1 hypothetical protein [Sphingomonas sp.]
MTWIIWCLGYAVLAAGLWMASAFLLRLGQVGRMLSAVAAPAMIAALAACSEFFDARAGWPFMWAPLFLIYGLFSGGGAATIALPIWFLFEEHLGWRAR